MENDNIEVSVIVITYNQSQYIRQAIDSILMQKVNLKYEILVGDDASTDGTQEILKEYADKYPYLFKLTLREENIGATKNAYDILTKAKGRYLATLEGDDFWTDKSKLQIQYDFMEKNIEYVGCTHKFNIVDENNVPYKNKRLNWVKQKEVFTINDFEGIYLPGQPSTFFRKNLFLTSEHDYSVSYKIHPLIGDRTLMLSFLLEGNFYCIDKNMGAYRVSSSSKSTNVTSLIYKNNACIEEYNITCKLEKYAFNEFNKRLSFSKHKRDIFTSSLINIIKRPTKENFYISYKIFKQSDDYVGSIVNIPIYIIKKILRRKLKK
ncbi:glycosyltransferase family 2 protein [Clostridium botulinum]|uniref:glycosyltransferase family 2 protein n=1 Tax=Clostridium botulinum TaxID=1491 RepID=UPI000694FD38|nr:glycosyltransferase family 2 protein [Clostridium botulinum]MBY6933615.1 glycosyltransferase family 2 protein [Clostridium botulinum]NFL83032.1 glycosyltransferase family 2 protein [Clostridium botulinum]NFN10474.1 glycosyltransferase family 2 protein [Clostridium botulinum]NFN80055.1 glycosyltransferase family 2 protein [Clostridium botulinum]NFO35640.1 glycosyltransferase family 2 protein [Clostridium botulinum]